jgi:serine/threonine protein kinase
MDYVNGGTLFNLIKKSKGLDEKIAFKYFINASAAINFLHENNMVHRDVKPENLLLDENGVVKLCDFGWCVELDVGARSTFCGTYEYMAPEIINESPYNNSIDVWSLGVLLYELLHGYSPFRAKNNPFSEDNYMEIFRNIVKYNFQIEKEISEPCADLLKSNLIFIAELITPESKKRIKIRDIFFHPWVRSFEAEYKEKIISAYTANSHGKCENKENLLVQNNNLNKQCPLQNIVNKDSKPSIKVNEKMLKEKEINEFSIMDPNKSLFDEVLNQVKNKNSIKKKKGSKNDKMLKSLNLSNTVKNNKKDEDKLRKRVQNSMLSELATLQYKLDDILNSTKMNEVSFISSKENVKTHLDTQNIFSDNYSTEHPQDYNILSTQSSIRKYDERVELNKDNKLKPDDKETNIITQSTCDCGNALVKRNEWKEMKSRKNSLDISKTVDIQITDKYNYKSNLRSSIYDSQNSNSIIGSEGFDKE